MLPNLVVHRHLLLVQNCTSTAQMSIFHSPPGIAYGRENGRRETAREAMLKDGTQMTGEPQLGLCRFRFARLFHHPAAHHPSSSKLLQNDTKRQAAPAHPMIFPMRESAANKKSGIGTGLQRLTTDR